MNIIDYTSASSYLRTQLNKRCTPNYCTNASFNKMRVQLEGLLEFEKNKLLLL